MNTVLGFWDFCYIFDLLVLAALIYIPGQKIHKANAARLRRAEAKLDLVLRHLKLEYQEPSKGALSSEVKALADDPAKKIDAIALHREQTGADLKEAKDAVEAYLAEKGNARGV